MARAPLNSLPEQSTPTATRTTSEPTRPETLIRRRMDGPSGIYDLDPAIREQLQLSTFEGKFDVKEFVGGVSEKLIVESKADPGPFDPKPFIRTFEAAVDKLILLRKDIQVRSEQMEKNVKVAEREYSKKMSDLNKGFEAVGQSFVNMESKMSDVGHTAVRIGEQLESVHTQKQRAQAAHDLIEYYIQFSRGDTEKLDVLRKQSGKEGRRQLAVILRRLNTVAKEVDLPTAEQTRENIEKYCEKFEKDMLNLFDRCYRKEDPKMMHHCAQTLQDFNGGASCVQIYVNQHDFFINRVRQKSDFEDATLWNTLSDPDAPPPRTEAGLLQLFSEIRGTVGEEAQIVQAVFPNPPLVMQVFLQRVFAQSIQQYMEQLLNKSAALSSLAFLRVLQLIHLQVSHLIEDLKLYELATSAPRSPAEPAEFRRSVSNASTSSAASNTMSSVALGAMLESATEELFMPYTEGQRYLERESKSLSELYTSYLDRYTRYHEKTHKAKASMFDRVVNQLSAAAATTSTTGTSSTSAQAAAALMKFSGISTEKTLERPGEDPIRDEDGQLSLDTAERMLKWHAEAVGRCVELSATSDVPKHAFALLRVLAEAMGHAYVETALEAATARLDAADPKLEPNLQGLAVLRSVDFICHLWQQYVSTALLPLASTSVTVRREMVIFNNQTVSRIEGAANALIQRLTDVIMAWLSTQLAKQKKNDFKPRNDDLSFARVNTEPCEACCEMLEKVRDAANVNLSGKNLESFFTELGVSFHSLLLDHLKRFPVNATGGLMLAKDLKSYQDIISTFNLPALHERFEFIRQLGNVFLVRPDILKSYITENYLGRIDSQLLRPYLAQRSDWGEFEKRFDGANVEDTGAEAKSFKDKLGMSRLSTMMKELEGLRIGDGIGMTGSLSGGLSRAFGNA